VCDEAGFVVAADKTERLRAVTVLATAFLAVSIANYSGGGTGFKARFRDVTSLNPGDEVRIAGVRQAKSPTCGSSTTPGRGDI